MNPAPAALGGRDPGAPLLVDDGRLVSVGEFLGQATAVAARLAGVRQVVNLCERRGAFLTGYVGALAAGATTLLPASRAPEAVAAVQALFPGARTLDDGAVAAAGAGPVPAGGVPVAADCVAMIGFTSGSTGTPSHHAKVWGTVAQSTRLNAAAIRAALPAALRDRRPWILGTVPSQHMYGMELTVLVPLLEDFGLVTARPLLPAEVAAALAATPAPRVLVSTPAHLRAIVASGIALPRTEVVVSATAPLEATLAAAVETATGGTLLEMFGATETCILGTRRTALESDWRAYPGVRFVAEDSATRVETPWFRQGERLLDRIEMLPEGRFRLHGRSADLVDVAGKRASLADLTQRLLQVPGVVDAVVFQPAAGAPGLVRRLAALVVAPGLTPAALRSALAPAVDPVFMPRPLLLVAALPRTAAGKLPQAALEAALAHAHGGE
ncbi:MAG: acyl-CoA synthetase [Proteobacteria bacterium]|nr:acyl-CoA synthetase [Pseudomonadota bacterium]